LLRSIKMCYTVYVMSSWRWELIRQYVSRLISFRLAEFLAWYNDQCGGAWLFGGKARELSLSLSLSLVALR
jgi:hypothetical protein